MNRFLLPLGNQRVLYFCLFFALVMLPPLAHAQGDGVVTGVVRDVDGPLEGVSVIVKRTDMQAASNAEGRYRIQANVGDTLLFRSVGYVEQEVVVPQSRTIDVVLTASTSALDEVVVVGYGTQRKSDLTGAVATVQGEDLAARRNIQISQSLQGQAAGVMVTRNSSAPGATGSIRIRGITTIGNSNPLYILDGVPVDDINFINPADVESISVLKDAASASIYGARAAAGVIVVTTKRAQEGQLSFTYNFDAGFETPTQLPEFADATRYMQMVNELRWNDNGNTANEYPVYTQDLIRDYIALNQENPDLYPITDWHDLILNSVAPRQTHSLSVRGGSKHIRTNASLVYDDIGALYDDYKYRRVTARFNNDVTVSDAISANFDIFYKRNMINQPTINPMNSMRIAAPIYAAQWSDGRVAQGNNGNNIYGQMKYGGFDDNFYNQIGGKLALNFSPLEGLKFTGVFSPLFNFNQNKMFTQRVPWYTWDDPTVLGGYLNNYQNTRLDESRLESMQLTTQFLATYDKSWESHKLNILGGYEDFYSKQEVLTASRNQYTLSSFPYLDLGPLDFRDNGGYAFENAYRSFFGRATYDYKERYLLQANIRYDGSSRFHRDHRWGAFPSVSAGWIISRESFFKESDAFSFFKLRASWGQLGNERIGNYPYQSAIGFNNALLYQGSNIVSAQTAAQIQYAIRDISWETTEDVNLGVDANFFKERLAFSGEYYWKTTKDMLLALDIPGYVGFENPDQNTGKMHTKGWEFDLRWRDKINDFSYSVSFNLSDFVSIMGDLGGTEFLGDQVRVEGSQFDEWYGYRSAGIYQTAEDVANSARLNPNVRVGDIQYIDVSGANGEPDGLISPEYDRVFLGGSLPRMMYGGNIRLGYKAIDFSLAFQGIGRKASRLTEAMARPFRQQWGNMPAFLEGNYWSHYNDEEQNQAAIYPRFSEVQATNNYVMSDFWLIRGDYFRVKNATIGYTFPSSFVSNFKVSNLRLYASASDFLTLSHFPRGWDPEAGTSTYPIMASFLFGASIQF